MLRQHSLKSGTEEADKNGGVAGHPSAGNLFFLNEGKGPTLSRRQNFFSVAHREMGGGRRARAQTRTITRTLRRAHAAAGSSSPPSPTFGNITALRGQQQGCPPDEARVGGGSKEQGLPASENPDGTARTKTLPYGRDRRTRHLRRRKACSG